MSPAQLGVELRARRLKAGLTQAAIARALGTTQPAVARIETGGAIPSMLFVDRWATATGLPLTITLGRPNQALTPEQKGQLVREVVGPDAFDPWERLERKQARGLNVEPERRDLMATLPRISKNVVARSRG